MQNNFRKLKEYDHLGANDVSILSLETSHCIFWYDGKTYQYSGVYGGEYDFLLEYYVEGIKPIFKIEHDKIVPYLFVTLTKYALDVLNQDIFKSGNKEDKSE